MCEPFTDDMIGDEDLVAPKPNPAGSSVPSHFHLQRSGRNVQQFVVDVIPGYRSRGTSARTRNVDKRKAKSSSKDQTNTQELISPKGMTSDLPNTNSVMKLSVSFLLFILFMASYELY